MVMASVRRAQPSRLARIRWLLLALAGSTLLVAAPPAFSGQNCAGPKPDSNGFLGWLKMLTARAVNGVMVEEAKAAGSWTFPICGAPNNVEPGYVPNGDPLSNGTAVMEINNNLLSISIDLGSQRYYAHHAHLYSTTSGYRNEFGRDVAAIGQSTVCWATSNLTENDSSTGRFNEKSLSVMDWPYPGGYAENWYKGYLSDIDAIGGGDWFVMVHMLGGHFAVDDQGHLIEWSAALHEVTGDEDVAGNFDGQNDIKTTCNARHGRRLNNRNVRFGSCVANLAPFNLVENYFLDQSGVGWLDSEGQLTPLAVDHGYDLETNYLFYSFADEGRAEQYGGPEGGAGGFINGHNGERCDNWPPAGWGDPHPHTVPEPSREVAGLTVLLSLGFLRRSIHSTRAPARS